MSHPAVSQHLRVLKAARLVTDCPEGIRRLYAVDPTGINVLHSWLDGFWGEALSAFQEAAEREAAEGMKSKKAKRRRNHEDSADGVRQYRPEQRLIVSMSCSLAFMSLILIQDSSFRSHVDHVDLTTRILWWKRFLIASVLMGTAYIAFQKHPVTPTPSIEAAQAVIYMAQNWNIDPDLEKLLRTLSASKSPEVRFQIAAGLGSLYTRSTQLFWEIADSTLSNEKATGVLEGLTRTIGQPFIAQREPDAVVKRLAQIVKRRLRKQGRGEVLQVLVDSLSQLHVYFNHDAADFVLRGFEKSPLRYP